MSIRSLPILLIGVLLIVAGCKKNSPKPTQPSPAQKCSGPELLAENILPDYLGSPNGTINVPDVIASDPAGNVYIENTSQIALSIDAMNGISGIMPGYLYKFDALGKQVYSKPAITSYQSGMAVDSMQNVYIGYFTIFQAPWHCIVNAVKYNSNGDTTWGKHIYYHSDALFNSLGVSNGGFLHVAAYVPSNPFDSQYNDPTAQVEPGSGDMVYTFDQSGKLINTKQIAFFGSFSLNDFHFSTSGDFNYATYNDGTANVNKYDITSKLTSTFNFPISANTTIFFDNNLNAYNIDSTSVTKYTANYSQDWTIKTHPFKLIKTDASGNIYITGTFNGSVNFNPNGKAKTLTANGANDSFMEKFDATGKMVWVIQSLGTDGKIYTGASQVDNFLITNKNKIFVTGMAFSSKTNSNIHFATFYTQCN